LRDPGEKMCRDPMQFRLKRDEYHPRGICAVFRRTGMHARGCTISQAAEYRTEKIKTLVYLSAF